MTSEKQATTWGGIFVKRMQWSLTWKGYLLVVCSIAILVTAVARGIYPFLAITERADDSKVLVVDGWLPTYELDQAVAEYARGQYDTVLAVRAVYDFETREPLALRSDYVSNILGQKGIPREHLHAVLFEGFERDRTLSSAMAIAEWMKEHNETVKSMNLVTEGPHARRSRLLYERAFGPTVPIGIVALKDPSFDSRHWWRSSEGVRAVLFEGFAYIFVRFHFFRTEMPPIHLLPIARADFSLTKPSSCSVS